MTDSEIPDIIKAMDLSGVEKSFDEDAKFLEELLATILSRNIRDRLSGIIEIEGQAAEVM